MNVSFDSKSFIRKKKPIKICDSFLQNSYQEQLYGTSNNTILYDENVVRYDPPTQASQSISGFHLEHSKKYLGPLFKELYKKIKSILIFEKDKKPRVKNIANLEQYRLILRTLVNIPVDPLSSEARQYLRYILPQYAAYFSVDLTAAQNLLL